MEFILLSLCFLGFVFVLFTKHPVLGLCLSLLGFAAYLFVQPQATWISALLLFVGLLLIGAECIIPDFGALGIVGAICLVFGVYWTSGSWLLTAKDLLFSTVIVVSLIFFLLKQGYQFSYGKNYILTQALTKERGYSVASDQVVAVGQVGQTVTPLRPVGKGLFGKEQKEIRSNGPWIQADKPVRVVEVRGNQIIVEEEVYESI